MGAMPKGERRAAATMPRLYDHIADARRMVVFLSPKYLFSAYCMRELQLSWEQEPEGRRRGVRDSLCARESPSTCRDLDSGVAEDGR